MCFKKVGERGFAGPVSAHHGSCLWPSRKTLLDCHLLATCVSQNFISGVRKAGMLASGVSLTPSGSFARR